jgi:hypothetical protein
MGMSITWREVEHLPVSGGVGKVVEMEFSIQIHLPALTEESTM